MAEAEQPQIYLITPDKVESSSFFSILQGVLDEIDIACLRLDLSTTDEDDILRTADALRDLAHARDIPLVIAEHVQLAERLGLDGVHLTDGARSVRAARKTLGPDAIVGTFCGTSRHDGLTAGEMGADYVTFGPIAASSLGDGQFAGADLFEWWSEVIEIPVVAEGLLDVDHIQRLAPITDFFAIGPEIWDQDDPTTALRTLVSAISLSRT